MIKTLLYILCLQYPNTSEARVSFNCDNPSFAFNVRSVIAPLYFFAERGRGQIILQKCSTIGMSS